MTATELLLFGLLMLSVGAFAWLIRSVGREDDHPFTVWHRKLVEPLLLLGLVSAVIGGLWLLVT